MRRGRGMYPQMRRGRGMDPQIAQMGADEARTRDGSADGADRRR